MSRKAQFTDLGSCPCGGKIAVQRANGCVSHTFPPCAQYVDLQPHEFLAYVRRSRGISDKEALAFEMKPGES